VPLTRKDIEKLPEGFDPGFGVYSPDPGQASGCNYYRIEVPFRGLLDLGLSLYFIDNEKRRLSKDDRAAIMLSSDIVLFFARGGHAADVNLETIRQMSPGVMENGEIGYPPSVVFDIDDNLDWVHPFNHRFSVLGTRAYDGTLLKPGDSLTTTFPDGSEIVVWKDQETVIDGDRFVVQDNLDRIAAIHRTAQNCEGVSVPNEELARYYRNVHQCDNVYIFPNSMIPEDWPQVELKPRTGGSIRILWQGGGSHMVDWFPLRDAVRTICEKYPQVKFVIWGSAFRWVHDNIPEAQLELHDWVDYLAYRPHRVLMDADINLCPLVDNVFNRGKSAIKWYEGAILKKPEPCLAGACPPYSNEIVDGETGLLYKTPQEFVEKLSLLIESAELRRKIGEAGKMWVLQNRHFHQTVPGLFEFYQEIRARKEMALSA